MTTAARKPKKAAKKKAAKNAAETSVGVRELRQSASKLLDLVKDGSIVEITEHGVPVARLVPIKKSLYEEFLESASIIPARNPHRVFTLPKGEVVKGAQLSELLIQDRLAEKF